MTEHAKRQLPKLNPWMVVAFVLLAGFVAKTFLLDVEVNVKPRFGAGQQKTSTQSSSATPDGAKQADLAQLSTGVVPAEGVELPIVWGDLGKQLISKGVIDKAKFEALFTQGGRSLSNEDSKILEGTDNKSIRMTQANSQFLLDMLWAFGLANKNDVLDKGEMMRDPKQVGNFASTGGWTLGKGQATSYFSKFPLVKLTPEQQILVENTSKGIYRPCCGNSTHFPDCNHGMAMLGLLELMAANGATEDQMYKVALAVNSYWFSQTYVEIAAYFAERGTSWDKVDPKEALGVNFSSAQGYRQMRSQIKSLPQVQQQGGGCGA